MRLPKTSRQWELLWQVAMAIIFFGFVAFGYNNGMSRTDIVFWLTLAGSSFGFMQVKEAATQHEKGDVT